MKVGRKKLGRNSWMKKPRRCDAMRRDGMRCDAMRVYGTRLIRDEMEWNESAGWTDWTQSVSSQQGHQITALSPLVIGAHCLKWATIWFLLLMLLSDQSKHLHSSHMRTKELVPQSPWLVILEWAPF